MIIFIQNSIRLSSNVKNSLVFRTDFHGSETSIDVIFPSSNITKNSVKIFIEVNIFRHENKICHKVTELKSFCRMIRVRTLNTAKIKNKWFAHGCIFVLEVKTYVDSSSG